MTRTRRFYNREPFGTWKRSTWAEGLFHPFKFRCMGHCHSCRDQKQDQRRLRKARTADLRRVIARELEALRTALGGTPGPEIDLEPLDPRDDAMYCAIGAEASLKDWLSPEEDAAWANL
jgi:hypothetical protein